MDKELTIQDLEAQADALLAAADEMEELLPADTGKSKRKKAEDEAPEKKAHRWTKRSSPDCPPPSSYVRQPSGRGGHAARHGWPVRHLPRGPAGMM